MNAWTDDLIRDLKHHHADGLTYSQIAARLGYGLTRNACIGKARRLGLEQRKRGDARPAQPRPVGPKRVYVRRSAHHAVTENRDRDGRFAVEEFQTSLSPADIPVEQRKQLLDLKTGDCRFPYGDVGNPDFFFCGGEAIPESSYCCFHYRVAVARKVKISDDERTRRHLLGVRTTAKNNRSAAAL